ncbi:MAG: DUF427 domain-containing protein [Vulcanimicrobiaceae bacterium]
MWDYPRPPRLESTARRLRVEFGGRLVAETVAGFRVVETSHPPVYYFPPGDVDRTVLVDGDGSSFCEFKGRATYYDLVAGERRMVRAAWGYPLPSRAFAAIASYVAYYATRVDACYVDDERVAPQAGDFYGGWITAAIVGPFKGEPGTSGW